LSIHFFYYSYADHPDLHSFPTRRSSDLNAHSAGGRMPQADSLRSPESEWDLTMNERSFIFRPMSQPQLEPTLDRRTQILDAALVDRKSTRLNSSHVSISYAVFCLKKKKK